MLKRPSANRCVKGMEGPREAWVVPMDSYSGAPSCTLGRHGIGSDPAILPMGTPKALSPADDRAGSRQPSHRKHQAQLPHNPLTAESFTHQGGLFQGREDVRASLNVSMGLQD